MKTIEEKKEMIKKLRIMKKGANLPEESPASIVINAHIEYLEGDQFDPYEKANEILLHEGDEEDVNMLASELMIAELWENGDEKDDGLIDKNWYEAGKSA